MIMEPRIGCETCWFGQGRESRMSEGGVEGKGTRNKGKWLKEKGKA